MEKMRSLSIRIEDDLRKKLHIISKYEGRSANAQINYLIRKDVEEFIKQHGKIDIEE